MKSLVDNKRARFDYFILDTYEAGIALTGAEVKSIRASRASLLDSYVKINQGQAYLINCFIHPYGFADIRNIDSKRERKLLLHKKEIEQIENKVSGKSITAVPLSIYNKNNTLKLLIGIGKGKKQFDKRSVTRERDNKKSLDLEMKRMKS